MQTRPRTISVRVADQSLTLQQGPQIIAHYPVSTSAFGIGSEPGSYRTPLGRFRICEMIGEGAAPGAIFKSRLPTGEFGCEDHPDDLVQTRILWLEGLDPENANTRERYIYIHGTNHEADVGRPMSHGCIRMRNDDVIRLFDEVSIGDEIIIQP